MKVTPTQARHAFAVLLRRLDPAPPSLRPSERDLLAEHLKPIQAFADALVDEPELIEALRAWVRERR